MILDWQTGKLINWVTGKTYTNLPLASLIGQLVNYITIYEILNTRSEVNKVKKPKLKVELRDNTGKEINKKLRKEGIVP
ncbi:MAG: hypothetical protein WBF28_02495, partial [Atribacterota bacterium]